LSIQTIAAASTFYMQEQNTGWQFSYAYGGNKGAFVQGNIETLVDGINLTFGFSQTLATNVYLSFTNIELIPFELV
jgi:hypothetical protein